jgi:type IV secretion system protein VirB8
MSIIDKLRKQPDHAGADVCKEDEGKLRPDQLGSWYLKQAMEFERSKTADAAKSKNIAWRCVGGMAALLAITVVTSGVVVLNNKPNPPGILMVNNETGEIRQMRTLADTKIKITQATDLFNLRRYVTYRESYDWEMIQDMFDATVLLSSPTEAKLYKAYYSEHNKLSPVNVLGDDYRVIANAGTVSFVGKTAIVSFSKKTLPVSGPVPEKPPVEYYQATITYEYEDIPMDDRDRGINPAGFKVTSYHVARDITRAAAEGTFGKIGGDQ